jgi:hypothetical protein
MALKAAFAATGRHPAIAAGHHPTIRGSVPARRRPSAIWKSEFSTRALWHIGDVTPVKEKFGNF